MQSKPSRRLAERAHFAAQSAYGVYAAIVFVVVVLLLFCPILVAAPSLRLRRSIGRLAVRAWLFGIGVPFRIEGLSNLPAGPCVVVCNHASYVDGIILTAALPKNFTFLVQHASRGWPYVGLIIRRMSVEFVNRDSVIPAALTVRRLIRKVEANASLAIFPEGSFRSNPGVMPFYDGAFFIAAKAGVPIVPAVLRGTRRMLRDGEIFPKPSRIEVELFAPIRAGGTSRAEVVMLRDRTRKVMALNCGELSDEKSGSPPMGRGFADERVVGAGRA